MNRLPYRLLAALVLAALAVGAYFWTQRLPQPRPAEPTAAAPASTPPIAMAPSEPAIKHPIAAASAAAPALPALDQSDGAVKAALSELVGAKSLSFLQLDGFARRVVATVDNLARAHAAPRLWPVIPTPGRFTIAGAPGKRTISADNNLRYSPFVLFVESVDAGRAAAVYKHLYPLFQQAFEELGYPGRYFNDRLVTVIDDLLATPEPVAPLAVTLTEIKGPEAPDRPWLRYEFADPALEALPAGQKMLLRTGPVNERRLKAKLTEFRRHIVAGAAAR